MTHGTSHPLRDMLDFVMNVKDEPGVYFEYVRDDDRPQMVFWASSEQQELALKFGDVIVLENTALTSRYVPYHVRLTEWDLPACAPSGIFSRKNVPLVHATPPDAVRDHSYASSPKTYPA